MAATALALNSSNSSRVEQVFTCMKDGMKSKPHLGSAYEASKAAARNSKAYWTHVVDVEAQRFRKFERKRVVLQRGFFTEKAKPFKTVGVVHIDDGDLILSGITDEFKARMLPLPKEKTDNLLKAKKSRNQGRRPATSIVKMREVKRNMGINAIKDRVHEVVEMKRLVIGEQPLSGYLIEKEAEMVAKENEKDPWKMLPPASEESCDKTSVNMHVNEEPLPTASDRSAKVSDHDTEENETSDILLRKTVRPFSFADLGQSKKRNILLDNWKAEKRQIFFKEKLKAINNLLCAIFNMRAKYLKSMNPLLHKLASDLLKTDVIVDEFGKPTANWKSFPVTTYIREGNEGSKYAETPSEWIRSSCSTDMAHNDSNPGKSDRETLSFNVVRTPTFITAQPSFSTFDTSEDFNRGKPTRLTAKMIPLANVPPPSADPASIQFKPPKPPKRNTIFPFVMDITPPWMTILQTEKIIHEKKVLVFGKKHQRRKQPNEILNDLKEDFTKLQMKLDKLVQEECRKERRNQLKTLRCKFSSIRIGPPVYQALEQMREKANLKIRNRMDNTMQPMKWFSDLMSEIYFEQMTDDEEVIKIVAKLARFQYDDEKSIPLAKEKLCLLVMSLPVHILLTASMIHGIIYVLKAFGLPQEIFQYWLSVRKLDAIGLMQRQMYE